MHLLTANALILLACGIFAVTALADPDYTYLEKEGIVLIEAEDGTPSEGWQVQTDLTDYEGSGYLIWTGPDSLPVSSAGKGNITYHFRIETAGNYQLLLRSYIAMGESNTESNDSWVRFISGADVPEEEPLDGWTKLYMNTLGDWSWASKTVDHVGRPLRQYFAQGDHTVEISGRSIGHAIDRLALYRYEDVPYNTNLIKGWELSNVVTSDGTIVNPGEITDSGNPDPEAGEPAVPEAPEVVASVNLFPAEDTWADTLGDVCTGDTLALISSGNSSVDPANSASNYTMGEFLTMSPGTSAVLMKFDLSLVPPVTSALLEYSTGFEASNGTVSHSLGSHSQWPAESDEKASLPDIMTTLSQASGGWNADTRYQSAVPATLLTSELITIILSNDIESEPLSVFGYTDTSRSPRLLLTGDSDLCTTWQSNLDARNNPVEVPAEVNEEIEPGIEPEPESEPEPEPEEPSIAVVSEAKTETLSGGFTSWLNLIILSVGLFARQIRHACSGKRSITGFE